MTSLSRRSFIGIAAVGAGGAASEPLVDAHVHLWNYDPQQYPWIGNPIMKADFGPAELKTEMDRTGVGWAIPVQARSSLEETEWLLDLAERHEFLAAVVGWLPTDEAKLAPLLEKYASRRKLRGVRAGVELNAGSERGRRFLDALRALGRAGLAYDIHISEDQLPGVAALAGRLPQVTLVLNHLVKPRIRERILSPWRENMREAARRPNLYCKLSGLVNAADPKTWTPEDLRPYIETALDTFGPRRLMFGSDWPVCLQAASYERWFRAARQAVTRLSPGEQAWIFGRAAARAYRLDLSTSGHS
ncbi:MAG: amidohydrolase family protein [Bryobacteraceae bacterium]|nr:amidohydrolase family protein [Bryobacteraceae bacterium]